MPSRAEMYSDYIFPVARQMDAERVHERSMALLHLAEANPVLLKLLERISCENGQRFEDEQLEVQVGGIMFENPVALAAGFDKQGRAVDSLYTLGFSSVVVGTVTQNPQFGNQKPRIFRPSSDSLINRMGYPGAGVAAMKQNLARYNNRKYPIGVSIGINKGVPPIDAPKAYAAVASELSGNADYFELGFSPNTPGLRTLLEREYLVNIVDAIQDVSEHPLFIKVSPDMNVVELDDVIQIATDRDLSIVATNTSVNSEIKAALGNEWCKETGGASGSAIEGISNNVIEHVTRESQVDVVGVGGVRNLPSALRKFGAGAKSLQVYTGFVMQDGGPTFPSRLNRELIGWMETEGVGDISEIVGQDI